MTGRLTYDVGTDYGTLVRNLGPANPHDPIPQHIDYMARQNPRYYMQAPDKYLQSMYKSYAGMNWPFTSFLLQDLSRLGKWLDTIFPILLWKFAKRKYPDRWTEEKGDMVKVWSEWILEGSVYGHKHDRHPGQIYNIGRRNEETRSFVARGGGFRLSQYFALDETQTALAMKQLERMNYNIYKTFEHELVTGLVDECIRYTCERERMSVPFSASSIQTYLNKRREMQFILHKGGIARLENHCYTTQVEEEHYPDIILMNYNTTRLVELYDQFNLDYMHVGPKAVDDYTRATQLDPTSRGRTPTYKWQVMLSIGFSMGQTQTREDPTLLLSRIGFWYRMAMQAVSVNAKAYTSESRDIQVVDFQQKKMAVLSFVKAMSHMPIFDKDQKLTTMGMMAVMLLLGFIDPGTKAPDALDAPEAAGPMSRYKRSARPTATMPAMASGGMSNRWRWNRQTAEEISGGGGVRGTQPYFRPLSSSVAKDSDEMVNHTHPYDRLPLIANLYTWLYRVPSALPLFLEQMRCKTPEVIEEWSKIIEDQESARKPSGGGGNGRYGGGSSGGYGGLDEDEKRSTSSRSGSGGGGGANSIAAFSATNAKTYPNIVRILSMSSDQTMTVVVTDTGVLENLDSFADYIQGLQLRCIITAVQLRNVAVFLIAILTSTSNALSDQIEQIRVALSGSSPDENALNNIISAVNAGVAAKREPFYHRNILTLCGFTESSADCAASSGKSDEQLKVMAQRTRISGALIDYFLRHDVHINWSLILIQPDITMTTCGGFVAKKGPQTGVVAIRDPRVTWTLETNDETIEVGCSFKARLLIAIRRNLLFVPDLAVYKYHGGGGTAFVNHHTFAQAASQNRPPAPSHGIFVLPERSDWVPPYTTISKSGSWQRELVSEQQDPHYTCFHLGLQAYRFGPGSNSNFMYPAYYVMDPMGQANPMLTAPNNQILHQGSYGVRGGSLNGRDVFHLEVGNTPFGDELTTQTAKLVHGEYDADDTAPHRSVKTEIRAMGRAMNQ